MTGPGRLAGLRRPDQTMSGRLALVTGAARGIGQQVALALAERGADLVLNDLRVDELDGTAEMAEALGARVLVQPFDAADHQAITDCLRTAEEQFGVVDVVVCNAALFRFAPFLDLDRADVEDVLRVNVIGAFDLAQQACRAMIRVGKAGRIIMISSVSAHIANPRQVGYAASKAGLHMLAKSIAVAVAEHGITVNCVSPGGPILTGQTEAASREPGFEEQVRRRVPIGRPGQPSDVASAVCYLAGPDADFVTGADIVVDGGLILGRP